MIMNGQCIFKLGYILFSSAEINKKSFASIFFGPMSKSLERIQCYFINYLRNIPSIPFMKMLSVFACKEYHADVGSISRIHLLGKLLQLSEQSQIELFDFIRNNVVDVIKLKKLIN